MTTKPSSAPWADGPLTLITTPGSYRDVKSHSAIYCATEMAHAHNCLLRALNAILLQGPHIASSDELDKYSADDTYDLLFYIVSWCKMVDHHHHTEESCMFPLIEALTQQPGRMEGAKSQHEAFHDGLIKLQKYCELTMDKDLEAYRWEDVQNIIDSFSESLTQHLTEEIDMILALEDQDSDKLMEVWKQAEDVAKANGNVSLLYDVFPCVLGSCDRTFEGGNEFPPLPAFMPYAIKYGFGKYCPGAWRFSPSDFWGQPRPLPMLPENRAAADAATAAASKQYTAPLQKVLSFVSFGKA